MKTIKYWLTTIEDHDVRERALKNTDPITLNSGVRNLRSAVLRAFEWLDSPEGVDFWLSVSCGKEPSLPVPSQTPFTATDLLMKYWKCSHAELDIILESINTDENPEKAFLNFKFND